MALTCFKMFLEVVSIKRKNSALFEKKILFVFPLIKAPGPAASVWNFLDRSGRPALTLPWWSRCLWEDGPMPVPQALVRGRGQGVADTWLVEGHLRNWLALALWLAVKVVLVCVFVFSFWLSIVETGLWFYQQRYVLRKGPSSRTWLTHVLFPCGHNLKIILCPSDFCWTNPIFVFFCHLWAFEIMIRNIFGLSSLLLAYFWTINTHGTELTS